MSESIEESLSIVLPARNEAQSLKSLLPLLIDTFPSAEVIVVDDGSEDSTRSVAIESGVVVISHVYAKGNGAAIKTGARAAQGAFLLLMDADGQHRPVDARRVMDELSRGYDLVVGARNRAGQAGNARWLANGFYNRFASTFVGHPVADLTSGLRACRSDAFREFIHLLPNGFSYPTTTTMAFFRAGYSVRYVPVVVGARPPGSKSHIRLWRDGMRFMVIIFKVGTLYSPLKLFLPLSIVFVIAGLSNYLYTFVTDGRFTNGSGLLLTSGLFIFLIGLISDQITQLLYSKTDSR